MSNDQWAPQGDAHSTPHNPAPQPHAPAPYGSAPVPPSSAPQTSYPHAPAPRRSGPALASMIIGIVALLLCLIPVVNIVSILGGLAAVVLGIVGIRKVVPGVVSGKGMAIAGIVTGAVATVVAAVVLAIMGAAINAVGSGEFQRAVEEAIEEAEAARPETAQPAEEPLVTEDPTTDPDATADDAPATGERFDLSALTCEDIADEAMTISEDGGNLMTLLEITELAIGEDHRTDYDVPSGTDESLVLSCTGMASWEDGSVDPILLVLTIDGSGELYVSYEVR